MTKETKPARPNHFKLNGSLGPVAAIVQRSNANAFIYRFADQPDETKPDKRRKRKVKNS